jgi:hypothetical protein
MKRSDILRALEVLSSLSPVSAEDAQELLELAGYEGTTVLPSPIRVQSPEPSPQRQIPDSQLLQLRQDLAEIKRKVLALAAEISAIEERIGEMEGRE